MMSQPHQPKTFNREVFGWCMYDFANSAYAACIQVAVFAVYFKSVVVPEGGANLGLLRGVSGMALWLWVSGFSMLLVAVSMPVLGAAADYTGRKKRYLMGLCWLGCLATGLMFLVGPGGYWLAMALLVVANFGMAGGNVFYNAFLPQIVPEEKVGRASGWAWGLGYVASALSLLLALAIIRIPGLFGVEEGDPLRVRVSLLAVGLWWAAFSIPTFLWLRERSGQSKVTSRTSAFRIGWTRIRDTLRHLRSYRETAKFLLAFFFYNDGVQTVILMSAVYGSDVLKLPTKDVIVIFLSIQLIAVPGTLAAGYLSDRIGHKRTVLASLVVWSFGVVGAYFVADKTQYWALCLVIGFVLGSVQTASRSLFVRLIPAERSAEFFGFYGVAGKFASILGPIILGSVVYLTGSARTAAFWLLPFFLVGIGLLWLVREPAIGPRIEAGR